MFILFINKLYDIKFLIIFCNLIKINLKYLEIIYVYRTIYEFTTYVSTIDMLQKNWWKTYEGSLDLSKFFKSASF